MHGQIIVDFHEDAWEALEKGARAVTLGSPQAYDTAFALILRAALQDKGFVFDHGKIREPWTNREVVTTEGDKVYRFIQGENEDERVRRAEAGLPI